MKQYEKYNDKALRPILQDIVDVCEQNDIDIFNPSYVDTNFEEVVEAVDGEIESYIGTPDNEDTTFFIAVLLMNKNFMTEPIKRPTLKTYKITHSFEKVNTVRETFLNEYDSYLPFTRNILNGLYRLGYYDPIEGELIDEETIDSNWSDDWVDDIEEI